jgi:hypothetical protein
MAEKPKPAGGRKSPSKPGKRPSARSRAAVEVSGMPSMTDRHWNAFFVLVRKLLEAEQQLGSHVATDQMRIAASNRGASGQLQSFMDIYR